MNSRILNKRISKKIQLIFFVLIVSVQVYAQGQWVWLHGDSTLGAPGSPGTIGVTIDTNFPRGFYAGAEWTDTSGNFWTYVSGGPGSALHRYIPENNTWTWVWGPGTFHLPFYGTQGIEAANVDPGFAISNNQQTWTDKFNNLWYLSEGNMWRFNISTAQWTWMHGPGTGAVVNYGIKGVSSPLNNPGSRRDGTSSWVDSNDVFWLYGATNRTGGRKSDLWKYDYTINEWTWVNGSDLEDIPPSYGTKGVPSSLNTPGARQVYATWYNKNTHSLYLFGGVASNITEFFNDLWRYDIATDMWTWVSGSSAVNDTGSYGVQCVPSINNYPPSKMENKVSWIDDCGNFWNFGGFTRITGAPGGLNDLWRYNSATNEWTWVKGPVVPNSLYNFGQIGIPDTNNLPRTDFGNSFAGSEKGFFMHSSSPTTWQYIPDPPTARFTFVNNCGDVSFLNISDPGCNEIKEYLWDFGDGTSSFMENPNHQYITSGLYNVSLVVTNCTWEKDTFSLLVDVTNIASSVDSVSICLGDSIFLGGNYRTTSGIYLDTLLGGTSSGCDSIAASVLTVNSCLSVDFSTSQQAICEGDCIDFTDLSNNASSWSWSFNGGIPATSMDQHPTNICFNSSGSFSVQLIASDSLASDTAILNVLVYSEPSIGIGLDGSIDNGNNVLFGNSVFLYVIGDTGTSTWSPPTWLSCIVCDSVISIPEESITYTVSFVDANGCMTSDSISIVVSNVVNTYIPNAFTPDADNLNETFSIEGFGVSDEDYAFYVFDRWGELIFESVDPQEKWDGSYKGSIAPEGIYIWKVIFKDLNGEFQNLVGRVSLLR